MGYAGHTAPYGLIAYCITFDAEVERMQALIAFEMTFGVFCILLGVTGLARKFILLIPNAVQAAILMGATSQFGKTPVELDGDSHLLAHIPEGVEPFIRY